MHAGLELSVGDSAGNRDDIGNRFRIWTSDRTRYTTRRNWRIATPSEIQPNLWINPDQYQALNSLSIIFRWCHPEVYGRGILPIHFPKSYTQWEYTERGNFEGAGVYKETRQEIAKGIVSPASTTQILVSHPPSEARRNSLARFARPCIPVQVSTPKKMLRGTRNL